MKENRRHLIAASLTLVVGVLGVLVGCSASAREKRVESLDERCRAISERFTGDLAFGESIGLDDLPHLRERIALIKALQDKVRSLPTPAASPGVVEDWLTKLSAFVQEMDNLDGQFRNARPGTDMLIIFQLNIVDEAASAAGAAAAPLGFDNCTKVESWMVFPTK